MKRALLLSLLFAGAVYAQDGGTDSPLGDAHGVRALGMGGAAAAWLDEPGAVWWNPATLVFAPVRRIELQHTKNALDTRTEHFAAVFPSLDYGAWAIAGALQTTTDIIVTGPVSPAPLGTESFHRFQLGAGYGFNAPCRTRLGATLKIVGYRFMNLERAAWGLDIGMAPFKRGGFQTGVAVQNVLPPTFSYADGLEDKWPRRGIAGVALRTAKDRLLVAAQAEMGQRQDSRFRVGAEYAPAEMFQVRAGYDGGGPTAGLGIHYSRFRIDYAFVSPSDLGSEHRFGISIDVGMPLDRQRAARDAKLDTEVRSALDRERQTQEREWAARADTAYSTGDWENAAPYYSQLQLLHPENALYSNRVSDLARRRDSTISARISDAMMSAAGTERAAVLADAYNQQMQAGQWSAALLITDRMVEAGGDSSAVAAMRQSATDSLNAAYVRAIDAAESALARERAAEAAGWAQAALLHKPDDDRATGILRRAQLRNSIQRATAALTDAVATGDTNLVLSRAQDLLSLDATNETGQQYLREYGVRPTRAVTIDQLKADSSAWSWYTQGLVEFRAGNFAKAIEWWERVETRYPGNEATRKNIEQARLRQSPGSGKD